MRLAARPADRAESRRARTASVLTSPDLLVVLCGTGSPLADATRAAACTAVIAGGTFVLVDVGPGSWEQVDLANLPIAELDAVLLTHFHSDHLGDLGEAITQSWIAGRTRPLDVYGPPGVGRILAGLREVYAFDAEYRVRHHGEDCDAARGRLRRGARDRPPAGGLDGRGRRVRAETACASPPSASITLRCRRPSATGSIGAAARSWSRATRARARACWRTRAAPTCSCTKRSSRS